METVPEHREWWIFPPKLLHHQSFLHRNLQDICQTLSWPSLYTQTLVVVIRVFPSRTFFPPHSLGSMILSLLSLPCLFFFSLVRRSVLFPFLLLRSVSPFYRSHEPTLMATRASITMFINTMTVPRGTLSISTMTIPRGTLSKRGRAPRAFIRF